VVEVAGIEAVDLVGDNLNRQANGERVDEHLPSSLLVVLAGFRTFWNAVVSQLHTVGPQRGRKSESFFPATPVSLV
jgi:hypothetical protein